MARKSYDEIVSETRKRNYYNRANKKDKSYEDIKRDQRDFRQFGPIEPTISTPAPTVAPTVTTHTSHSGGTHGGKGGTFTPTKSAEALKREQQGRRWAEAHPTHDRTAATTATPTTETGIRARANATAERERRLAEINAAQRAHEGKPDWKESLGRVASALSGNTAAPTKNEPLSLAEKYRQDYGLTQEQYEREKAEYDAKVRARSQQALENTYSKLDKRGKDLLKDYDEGTGFRQRVSNAATAIAQNMTGNEVGTTGDYNTNYEKAQQAKKALRDEYGLTDDQITQLSVRAKRERDSIESNKDKVTADAQNYARQHPVRASLTSLGTNVVGNIAGGLGTLENFLDNAAMYQSGYQGGSEFEENNPYYAPTRRTQAIRDTVANEKINNRVGSFIYQTAMSGADSAIAALIGAALPAGSIGPLTLSAGGTMLGMGAATSTMLDLADKGADYGTSVMGGLVSGAFEMLFEDISISQLDTFKKAEAAAFKSGLSKAVVKDNLKLLAKKLGATTFTNATEEGFTEIANLIYDTAANDGYSQYAEYYNDALKNGASPDEAKKIAIENMTMQVLEAAAGGALMGFMFGMGGGVNLALNYNSFNKGATRLGGMVDATGQRADVINTAEAMPEGSESQRLLDKFKKSKKGLTDNRLGRLAIENETYLQNADVNTIQKVEAQRAQIAEQKGQNARDNFDYYELTNSVVGRDKNGRDIRMVNANVGDTSKGAQIFSKGNNGAITFKTSDGKTMELNKRTVEQIQNPDTKALAKAALVYGLGADGANLLFDSYNPETLTSDHTAAFMRVYRQGALGTQSKALFGTYGEDMDRFDADQQQKILAAGLAEKQTKPGATDWRIAEKGNKFVSLQVKAMNAVAKALSKNGEQKEIFVVDDLYEEYTGKDANGNDVKKYRYLNGQYLTDTGKIIISARADKGLLLSFLAHEMGHEMKVNDINAFNNLTELVKAHYGEDEYNKQLKKFTELGYSEADAEEELICNSLFDVFDKDTIKKVFGKDRAAAVKLYRVLETISNAYNSAMSEYANSQDYKGELKHADIQKLNEDKELVNGVKEIFVEYLGRMQAGEYKDVKGGAVKNSVSDRNRAAENFNELYTLDKDGILKPKNIDDLSTEDWNIIYKTTKKLGYDIRSAADAKQVFGRYVGKNGFNEEQSAAIAKAYGAVNAEETEPASRENPARMLQAEKHYGTTTNFAEAGYLLRDGKMLDFSGYKFGGSRNMRSMDHREIHAVFDTSDSKPYDSNSRYMNAFISEGQIRLMDGQGVTIGELEPTEKQYSLLNKFIERTLKSDDYFAVDIINQNGYNIENREYDGDVSPRKIIDDIKYYYKNGEMPYQSELSGFYAKDSVSDREYLDAVKTNDMARAEQMVEEAAKEWGAITNKGDPTIYYHGTKSRFTVFDRSKIGSETDYGWFGKGFYFTPDKDTADIYSDKYGDNLTMPSYLKLNNPLDLNALAKENNESLFAAMTRLVGDYEGEELSDRMTDYLRENGYDGVYAWSQVMILDSNQAKSADPVTYDDNGEVIPLSERFNSEKSDIRYSVSDRDTEYMQAVESGNEAEQQKLVDEAAEAAMPNSKVRDENGKLLKVFHGRVSEFNVFDRSYGNAEGDFGRAFYFTNNEDDVEANYANEEGPDLTNKIEHFRDIMDSSEDEEYNALSYEEKDKYIKDNFITAEPNIVEAYVNIQNPVYIAPNSEGTYFDFNYGYDEETDEYDEPSGLLVDFVEALQEAAQDYWYGGRESPDFSFLYEYGDGMYAADAVGMIKHKSDNLYDIMTEDGDLALNEVIRSAFEIMGYDGIIDSSVPYKFSHMTGMNRDTVHYLAFDSSQIKRADAVTYDDNGDVIPLSERFNPYRVDIRYSLSDRGDVAEYEAEQFLDTATDDEIRDIVDEVDRRLQNVPYFEDKQEQTEVYAILDKMREKRDRLYEALSMDTGNESLTEYNRNTRNEMFGEAEPEGTIEGNKLIGKGQRQNIKKADAEKLIRRYKNVHHDRGTPLSLENLDEATAKLQSFYEDMQNNPDMAWDEVYDKAKDVAVEVIKFTKRHKEVHHPGKIYQQTYNTRYYNPFNDYTDDTGRNYGRESISDSFVLKPGAEEWLAPIINDIITDYFDVPVSNSDAVKTANLKTTYKNQIQALKNQLKQVQARARKDTRQAVKAQREKDVAYYNQRMKEIRADRDQKLIAQRLAYQKSQQNRRENNTQRELKGKILRRYQRLDQELRKPNANRYVPADLVNTVAGVLGSLTDTLQTEEAYKNGREIKSHIQRNKTLADLKVTYDAMQTSGEYSNYFDPTISALMQEVAKNTAGKTINEMDSTELQQVYTLVSALDHTVRNAAKLEIAGKEHDAFKLADRSIDQLQQVKKKKINGFTKYWYDQMNARSFFRQLSGYTEGGWMDVYNLLNEGQLKQSEIKAEVTEAFRELTSDKQARDLMDTKKLVDIGLRDADGNAIPVTRGIMIGIYMDLLNEDNTNHIAKGGLTVPDLEKYYKGDKEAYGNNTAYTTSAAGELRQINREINALEMRDDSANYADRIAELEARRDEVIQDADYLMNNIRTNIEQQLTDYDRAWIEKAKWFFDEYSKSKLNDATMRMYGFNKANVNNYFPIRVDKTSVTPSFGELVQDMTLEGSGFMKDRQKGASNPIYAEDIVDVIKRQMDNVAAYAGLAPAIKDFNKMYGKSKTTEQGESIAVTSVQKAVKDAFGQYGLKYISDLGKDLQGARKGEPSILSTLRGNAYQAALTLNLRVAMAQAGSFPTAAAEVGWEPILKALRHGGKNNTILSKADRELISKYTPLLENRLNGGNSTVDLNNLKTLSAHSAKGLNARILQKTAPLTDWISKVDAATVGRLWYAAQYYVDDNSNLQKGTDEYYQEVAKVFNRIVERTQPSYTTMQRSALLRNPNEAQKFFTMYMTQRSQNFNLLYDSAMELNAMRQGVKNGTATQEQLASAKENFGRTISSQLAAGLTLSAMKIFADAIQHNMKGYRDDDEDEVTAEKILEKLGTTWLESEISNVFLGSEIYSLISTMITGEAYYGISVNVTGALTDFTKDLKNMVSNPSPKSVDRAFRDAATILGIPSSQIQKFAKMGIYWYQDIVDGGGIWSVYEGEESNKQMVGKMVAAYLRGDMAQYRTRSEALNGKSDSSVKSAITSYVEEKVLSGDMSEAEARRVFINVYGKSEKETDKKLEEIRQKKAGTYEKKESKKWGG